MRLEPPYRRFHPLLVVHQLVSQRNRFGNQHSIHHEKVTEIHLRHGPQENVVIAVHIQTH